MSRLIIVIIAVVLLAFAAVSCTSKSKQEALKFQRHMIELNRYHNHTPSDIVVDQVQAVTELRDCLTLKGYHDLTTYERAEAIHKIMYQE